MYSAVVIVPAVIVYWLVAPFTAAGFFGPLLLILLLIGVIGQILIHGVSY